MEETEINLKRLLDTLIVGGKVHINPDVSLRKQPATALRSSPLPKVRNSVRFRMSHDNVARILNECQKLTKATRPELPHLHCHLFRRTRAMHLLEADVPMPNHFGLARTLAQGNHAHLRLCNRAHEV